MKISIITVYIITGLIIGSYCMREGIPISTGDIIMTPLFIYLIIDISKQIKILFTEPPLDNKLEFKFICANSFLSLILYLMGAIGIYKGIFTPLTPLTPVTADRSGLTFHGYSCFIIGIFSIILSTFFLSSMIINIRNKKYRTKK